MPYLKYIALVLAFLLGVWFLYDGTRALTVGDYTTPSAGPHAGQLGPWSKVISALGLDPRSTPIKILHLAFGLAWIAAAITYILTPAPGWYALVICAVLTLWYLPVGTLVSILILVLLLILRSRST